jgi:hypothetical protein
VLVETVTMTAAREAVRVYVQEIGLETGAPTPMATQLPGLAPAASLFSSNGDALITATADSDRGPASIIVGVAPAAAEIGNGAWRRLGHADSLLAGTIAGSATAGPRAVVVSAIDDGPLRGHGRIDAWAFSPGPPLAFSETPATWLLPGVPAAAVTHAAAGWVAVLCRTPSGGTVVHIRDAVRGRVIQERVPLARPNEQLEPAAFALAADGSALFAVLNDSDASSDTDEGRCWVAARDARSFAPLGPRVELPGTVDARDAVVFSGDGACWIASRSPSAGFAFLHQLVRAGDRYEIRERQSYSGLSRGLVVAASSEGASVAVAIDRRVELWVDGKPGGAPILFDSPVSTMCWLGDTLLVGEANRVHAVAADRSERWTTALQTGQVAALQALTTPLPPERVADSDNDRLADAIDPQPGVASPRLDAPVEIVLREQAAGTEVRVVRIDSANGRGAIWRVDFDADSAPWLRLFPRQGRVPGWFVTGIDPTQLAHAGEANAAITLAMSGVNGIGEAAGSPRRIAVRVTPRSEAARAVLWLSAGQNGSGLDELKQLLSGPPFHWSQSDRNGRALESIDDYAAVVLESDAIDAGVVSRQALLDYVARGGGLLVIARAGANGGGVAQRWLAPAGIVLEPGSALPGTFDVTQSHAVTRHWERFAMDGGARIAPDSSMSVLAANGDAPGLAVRQFGRGRIAVLASRAPLESDSIHARANRLFALDLFEWLSRAAIETRDIDADGLPDELEDKNDNGVMDRGETSKLDPDSDGDGVPDGKEDANANGAVDDGETNPLNADTDGDGDLDGADSDPLPPFGAPVALGVLPVSGPAQGGTRVAIDGRHLGNAASVWFGARQAKILDSADGAGLVVETPPLDLPEGGAVDVRIESSSGQSAVLPGGFVYGARTRIALELEAVAATDAQFEGVVRFSISASPGVSIGRVAVRLDTEPTAGLEWFDLRLAPEAELAGRRIVQRETRDWGIAFEVTPPSRPGEAPQLATVRCRSRYPLGAAGAATIVTKEAVVSAVNGEALDVVPAQVELRWIGTEGDTATGGGGEEPVFAR